MTLKNLFENDEEDQPQVQPDVGLLENGNENYDNGDDGEDPGSLGRDDMGGGDMGGGAPMGTRDERFLDRMIKVKGMPIPREDGSDAGFLYSPEFLEQLILNSFDRKTMKQIWRRSQDVSDLSQGDGNQELARQESRSLAWRILSQRSDIESPLQLNERSAWIESRTRSTSTVKTNQISAQRASGFLARLFGR